VLFCDDYTLLGKLILYFLMKVDIISLIKKKEKKFMIVNNCYKAAHSHRNLMSLRMCAVHNECE